MKLKKLASLIMTGSLFTTLPGSASGEEISKPPYTLEESFAVKQVANQRPGTPHVIISGEIDAHVKPLRLKPSQVMAHQQMVTATTTLTCSQLVLAVEECVLPDLQLRIMVTLLATLLHVCVLCKLCAQS